jgi:phosphoglycolate phosphatase-like HAD superfamily hydrolase
MVTLDFDGTTADTMPTLESYAVKLITKYYGLREEDARTNYRNTTGLPFEQQINILFPDRKENKKVIETFEREKIDNIFDLPLFDDAIETINFLREQGYLVAISSSTFQSTIEKYCQLKNLKVDQILGYRPGFEKGRNHFEFLMKKFDLIPDELVYIGDSLKDCERAQGSDILFIGRIGMFNEKQFNEISKSKIYIYTLAELKEIIPKLTKK